MRIIRLRLICHHSFLSTRRSSRKSLRILYHSVLNKGKCKFQHETGEEVQLSLSFFADAYLRDFLLLTHISPFWRTFESNDKYYSDRHDLPRAIEIREKCVNRIMQAEVPQWV